MGVEIRRVPPGWSHPFDEDGQYIPLHDEDYESAGVEWIAELTAWERGDHPGRKKAEGCRFYWDYVAPPPAARTCRPKFEAEPTCYQLYENTSEGTPISEVFATLEEFTQYLLDQGHSEKAVRIFIEKGFAPSMYASPDGAYYEGIDVWEVLGEPAASADWTRE
jgi:hypothetical protein